MSLGIGIYEISISLISTYVTCKNRFQIEKIFSQQHLFLILPKYQNITTTILYCCLIRSRYCIILSRSMDRHGLSLKKVTWSIYLLSNERLEIRNMKFKIHNIVLIYYQTTEEVYFQRTRRMTRLFLLM